MITVRLITRDKLPQLLALYHHLNPIDAPLPADDVLQSIWDAILHDPRLYYIVADIANHLVATCNLTTGLTQLAQCERQLLVHKYYLNLIPNALYL
ncbi:hypothetical protein [Nostoc flagelliforme]|uniref:hypothetical protein n=1 Tax=Nostoc flagelliforme TaxID=1306274 RepID=UPI001F548B7B|nr:hypothetical protein [Nostoc flagelliforme]